MSRRRLVPLAKDASPRRGSRFFCFIQCGREPCVPMNGLRRGRLPSYAHARTVGHDPLLLRRGGGRGSFRCGCTCFVCRHILGASRGLHCLALHKLEPLQPTRQLLRHGAHAGDLHPDSNKKSAHATCSTSFAGLRSGGLARQWKTRPRPRRPYQPSAPCTGGYVSGMIQVYLGEWQVHAPKTWVTQAAAQRRAYRHLCAKFQRRLRIEHDQVPMDPLQNTGKVGGVAHAGRMARTANSPAEHGPD